MSNSDEAEYFRSPVTEDYTDSPAGGGLSDNYNNYGSESGSPSLGLDIGIRRVLGGGGVGVGGGGSSFSSLPLSSSPHTTTLLPESVSSASLEILENLSAHNLHGGHGKNPTTTSTTSTPAGLLLDFYNNYINGQSHSNSESDANQFEPTSPLALSSLQQPQQQSLQEQSSGGSDPDPLISVSNSNPISTQFPVPVSSTAATLLNTLGINCFNGVSDFLSGSSGGGSGCTFIGASALPPLSFSPAGGSVSGALAASSVSMAATITSSVTGVGDGNGNGYGYGYGYGGYGGAGGLDGGELAGVNGSGGGDLGDGDGIVWGSEGGSVASWILVFLLSLLIVVTIIGNVLVCLSVILVRKLRKPQNYLLVSLATSDLFVALFVMPFAIVFENASRWPFKSALCDLWVSADVLCCTASILNLCGISVDRYQAITAPFDYSARSTPRRMLAVIFIVWLGSACVSLPPLLLLGNKHFDENNVPICEVSKNVWYQIYATLASFYVPLCVMVVVYVKILRVVADKKKQETWKKQTTALTSSHHHHQKPCQIQISNSNNSSSAISNNVNVNTNANNVNININANTNPSTNPSPLKSQAQQQQQQSTTVCSNSINKPASTILTNKNLGLAPHSNSNSTSTTSSSVLGGIMKKGGGGARGGGGGGGGANGGANGASNYLIPTITIHRVKKEKFFSGLKEHKASTTLGIIMSAFIVCWLPFFVLALVRAIFQWVSPGWVYSLFNWLGYANSALNPVIYATLNRDFRRPFKEILCFRCSTLDSIMRQEFYHQHYGDDTVNLKNKQSIPIDSDGEPPTSL